MVLELGIGAPVCAPSTWGARAGGWSPVQGLCGPQSAILFQKLNKMMSSVMAQQVKARKAPAVKLVAEFES